MADVHWLGRLGRFEPWRRAYTSDYFDRLYQYAVDLVRKGKAYVDDMTPEQTDRFVASGKRVRFAIVRSRKISIFFRMYEGGANSPNQQPKRCARRPSTCGTRCGFYRIRHRRHHTGIIYYLGARSEQLHGHRLIPSARLKIGCRVRCYEARSARSDCQTASHDINFTGVISKRKLIQLVNGLDDPRMITIAGLHAAE